MEEKKKCPYCGEEILANAKKCKHCGEWLETKPNDKKPSKSNSWKIIIIVVAVLAAISPFAINKISEMNQDAQYERLEEQKKKEMAKSISEDKAFLEQAKGNIEFMGTPVGGNRDDFLKMLKKHHSELFSTSPQMATEEDKAVATWEGDYESLKHCEYKLVADKDLKVLYLNISIDGVKNNLEKTFPIYKTLTKKYGKPYSRIVKDYKELARWTSDDGIIDLDVFFSIDKINFQFGGRNWKDYVLTIDPKR